MKHRSFPIFTIPYAQLIETVLLGTMNLSTGKKRTSDTQLHQHWLEALRRATDQSQLNPAILPASKRAYREARKWIISVYNKHAMIGSPHILIPGDGGLILKWQINTSFVSANFDEEDTEMDTILYRLNNTTNSEDFNEDRLEELIAALTAVNNTQMVYVLDKGFEVSSPSPERIWADFVGSNTIASHP